MNEMQRAQAREDRRALAVRLKDALDAGRATVADVAKATKSDPTTILAWMAGFQVPQKKAARRLARFLDALPQGASS